VGSAEYRAANRERLRAEAREYRLKNLDRIKAKRREDADAIREYQKAYTAEWRERNADGIRQKKAEAYRANPEVVKERVRRWNAANPERRRETARINARRRLLGGDADARDYGEVLRRDPCSYCGGPAGAVDHITAVARGGPNTWTNFTAACTSCNSRKSTKDLLTHLITEAA
jgi:5-methylcytosine-specific restriction endonuclease McrA